MFDAVMAGLLIAMMAFAIKLNRGLTALRDRDAEILSMIDQFRTAADQADAAATKLKNTGIEAERSLRATLRKAESVRDELARLAAPPAATPFAGAERAEDHAPVNGGDTESLADISRARAARPADPVSTPDRTRTEAERDLIEAIRAARVES